MVVTLGQHLTSLPSHITGARFISPTQFTLTLQGVAFRGTAPATTVAASGLVQSATVAPQGADLVLTVQLRSPATHDEIAVGGGNEFQITFS